MNSTPISKKPSKDFTTGIWKGDYTRIWTAVDRNSGSLFEFEVGSGNKSTYLQMALRIEERHKIKHLCTDGNKSCGYYKISEQHHVTKSETCLVESWNCRLRHCPARLHGKTLCYSNSIKALATAVSLLIYKKIALSVFI